VWGAAAARKVVLGKQEKGVESKCNRVKEGELNSCVEGKDTEGRVHRVGALVLGPMQKRA